MMGLIVALLVAGFLLIFIETLVPGLIVGTVGLIAVVSGIVLAFREYGMETGSVVFGVTLLAVAVVALLGWKLLPRTPVGRRMLLNENVAAAHWDPAAEQERHHLVGLQGEALTDLRPAGKAVIDGKRWDVVTDGGYIDAGRPIKVVDVAGARIVVTAVDVA